MLRFNKQTLYFLYASLAVLIFVFVFLVKSFQPLYYLLWVIGIGGYVYRNQEKVRGWLQRLPGSAFAKYLGIGIAAILLEEIFATTAMHLMRYLTTGSFHTFFADVGQFWLLNLLALPGIVVAWYVLLRRYSYSYTEIFWLAGIFGLYSEKIYKHAVEYPIFGWALIVPTIFTYGLLILLPAMSLTTSPKYIGNKPLRYVLALILPFIFSIPLVAVLMYINSVAPHLFPPFGFFQ